MRGDYKLFAKLSKSVYRDSLLSERIKAHVREESKGPGLCLHDFGVALLGYIVYGRINVNDWIVVMEIKVLHNLGKLSWCGPDGTLCVCTGLLGKINQTTKVGIKLPRKELLLLIMPPKCSHYTPVIVMSESTYALFAYIRKRFPKEWAAWFCNCGACRKLRPAFTYMEDYLARHPKLARTTKR